MGINSSWTQTFCSIFFWVTKHLPIHWTKKQNYISFITQLELLSFSELSNKQLKGIQELLNECVIIDLNAEIKNLTVDFRKRFKLKLPDCIIAATAYYLDLPLITADSDFKKIEELNLIYYEK